MKRNQVINVIVNVVTLATLPITILFAGTDGRKMEKIDWLLYLTSPFTIWGGMIYHAAKDFSTFRTSFVNQNMFSNLFINKF
jgi:hypothetical protein